MAELLDITAVEVRPGYRLLLRFENRERRIFDMTPFLSRPPFDRLMEGGLFEQARVHDGTVVWPGDLDLSPETFYDRSVPLDDSVLA